MTKAKRFLSAVMAVVMVATMFSCLGVVAGAYVNTIADEGGKWVSETTPGGITKAKTYAELSALYGDVDDNTVTPWVYQAIEVYEKASETVTVDSSKDLVIGGETWTLTDHYLQPDQELFVKFYVISNCYGGGWQYLICFTRSMFDSIRPNGGTPTYNAATDLMGDGLPTGGYIQGKKTIEEVGGITDPNNDYWANGYGSTNAFNSGYANPRLKRKGTSGTTTVCGMDHTIAWGLDVFQTYSGISQSTTQNLELFNDSSIMSFKIKVRSDEEPYQCSTTTFNPVPSGSVGHIGIDNFLTYLHSKSDPTYINIGNEFQEDRGYAQMPKMNSGTKVPALDESTFMTEDCNHTFVIGTPGTSSGYDAKFFDGETEYANLAVSDATSITLPAAQTKEGFTFGGWSDGTTTYEAGASYTLTADTNFTAVWIADTYTLSFFDGASEYTALSMTDLAAGSSVNLPAAQTKQGFRFAGWSDGTTTYQAGASYTVTGDVDFTAVWTALYTATFVDENNNTLDTAEYAEGETIVYPSVNPREGFSYAWSPNPATMPAANTTFQLIWTAAQSSITFNTNGGTAVAPITGNYGDPITAPDAPTKTGYTFAGWYSDPELTTAYQIPATLPADAVTVYAKWDANSYNADFYIQGEETPYQTVSALYGETFTAPELPSAEGYTFSAWTPSDFVMNAEGRDYYTTKTANSYTFTFKDINGTTVQSGTQIYGNTLQVPDAPEVTGQTFSGWTGDDGSFIADGDTVDVPAKSVVYTATYGAETYTLTYKVDGEVVGTQNYTYNANVIPLAYEAPSGKTWSGWQNLPSKMPAADTEVTSTTAWIDYTVTYLNYDNSTFATFEGLHYGDNIPVPAGEPTAPGKEFVDWDNDAETVTGNATISALWNNLSYNIVFTYGLEGENSEDGGSAAYGSTIYSSTFPNEDAAVAGYSLKWQYNGEDVGSSFTVPALAAGEDIEFTAVYTKLSYTITYTINGSSYTSQTYLYGDPITAVDKPEETGYDVSDWTPALPATMPAENLTVDATKTPHVYTDTWYDIDGETVLYTEQVAYLANIPVKEINPDDYPGMTGLQWTPSTSIQPANDVEFYLVGAGAQVDVTIVTRTQDLDLVNYTETTSTIAGTTGRPVAVPSAQRTKAGFTLDEENSVLTATVAGDGSTVLTITFTRNTYQVNVIDGETTTAVDYLYGAEVADPTPAGKTGYSFTEWSWTRANNGASVAKPATMPAYNLNATAGYVINQYNFTATVDGVAGTPVAYNYGASVNEPAAQTREGYTFDGWYLDADYTEKATFPIAMPAEDLAVYARFVINQYTYTFNTDGGTEIDPITADYGTEISVEAPVKEGYTFQTWSPSLPATMGAGDQTFTAIYRINTHTVTYKDGDNTVKTVTANYGTALDTLAAPTVSKTGYTFGGWDFGEYEGTTLPDADLVATAIWTVNSYNAVFYAISGDAEPYTTIENVEFGTSFNAPACDVEREYYEFVGWTDGTATYAAGDPITMDAEGKSFTGVWQQDTNACRVQSVVRVSDGYYQLGHADYEITIAAGVQPDQIVIDANGEVTYLSRLDYVVGRNPMVLNITTNEAGQEVWTARLTLEATTADTYLAYCEVDGVFESRDSAFRFGVTYDEKGDEAIAEEFISADISGLSVVRGEKLTWTIVTTTDVAWLQFVGTYTDAEGAEQTLITYYKYSGYRDGDGVETAKVTDSEGIRTWVIPMIFNYAGTQDKVAQTWNILYKNTGSSTWNTAVVANDGSYATYAPVVTVARKAEALVPATENYEKYTLVSVACDTQTAKVGDTATFTIVTTDDVSKVRIGFVIADTGKTKTATYQETSSNVIGHESANGLTTWTITYKFSKVAADSTFNVECRGLSWGETKTATIAVTA